MFPLFSDAQGHGREQDQASPPLPRSVVSPPSKHHRREQNHHKPERKVKTAPAVEKSERKPSPKQENGVVKSPLTPPRSPSAVPNIAGDYTQSLSERIKCRSRSCIPCLSALTPGRRPVVSLREPEGLTPKVASKLIANATLNHGSSKKEKRDRSSTGSSGHGREQDQASPPPPRSVVSPPSKHHRREQNHHKPERKVKTTAPPPPVEKSERKTSPKQENGVVKSPLTPPRSPSAVPNIAGDYTQSLSERIKCRSRSCKPKFYGEPKEDQFEEQSVPVMTPSARTPPAPPTKEKRRGHDRARRHEKRRSRRDSIESDGEKIRNILERSGQSLSEGRDEEEEEEEENEKPPPRVPSPKPQKVTPPAPKQTPKPPKKEPPPPPKVVEEPPKSRVKQEPPKPHPPPPLPAVPAPQPSAVERESKPAAKIEKTKSRLSDSGGLFEMAISPKLKSSAGRIKKQVSSESKVPGPVLTEPKQPIEPVAVEKAPVTKATPTTPAPSSKQQPPAQLPPPSASKFKPVKQSSPKEITTPTPTEDLPKFKPLPMNTNAKKSKSFKFRTPQGAKHDMNLVDSIFSNDSNSLNELTPLTSKVPPIPVSSTGNTLKVPVTRMGEKPPRPELVMGIPNLQGPSKPPMLTAAHSGIHHGPRMQHMLLNGPPPLSSPKIPVKCTTPTSTVAPVSSIQVAQKRPSLEQPPGGERKKKRFAFPTEDATPAKVTSPISPSSPLKGPGSSRVSPISPHTNIDNILTNAPLIRNGMPLHKPSPKNSPLVKMGNSTSPITPRASPSMPPNCHQRPDQLSLSESLLEHGKLTAGGPHRTPVVTINHQTIAVEADSKDAKARLVVQESEALSKRQQQEIFARQQLYSRAFPFSFPTTAAPKLNFGQHHLKQPDLGSLVDFYGRGESQPAFPTQLRQHAQAVAAGAPQQQAQQQVTTHGRASNGDHGHHQIGGGGRRGRAAPAPAAAERLLQERILNQERLRVQQRQQVRAAEGGGGGRGGLFPGQVQEALLNRSSAGPGHLQHLSYGPAGGVLNQIGYPMGINPQQLYKQLASGDPSAAVTNASILQSFTIMSINWAEINEKLPSEKTPEQKERRMAMFDMFDPNGNGILSLAEVDKAIRDVLAIDELFDCKPAIMRAFQAAKDCTKSRRSDGHGDDYIEKREFRFFLHSLRQYFEYFVAFARIDSEGDRRINIEEFVAGKDMMEVWVGPIDDMEAAFAAIDSVSYAPPNILQMLIVLTL
eukprot:sb/3461193/